MGCKGGEERNHCSPPIKGEGDGPPNREGDEPLALPGAPLTGHPFQRVTHSPGHPPAASPPQPGKEREKIFNDAPVALISKAYRSLLGPGGERRSMPPKSKPLLPDIRVMEWPERLEG